MKRTVKRRKSTKAASEDLKTLLSLDLPLPEATRRFQVAYIKKQIARARGNITDAAERLGLHRSNLYRKMRLLGMIAGVEKASSPRKMPAKKKTVTRNPSRKKKAAKK
jgi:DNA-binding NtrC family response regulator